MFYSYVLSEAFISIVYPVLQAVSDKVCHEYFWSEEDTVSGGELWKTAGIFLLLIIGSARRCLGKAGIQQSGYRENRAKTARFDHKNQICTKGVGSCLSEKGVHCGNTKRDCLSGCVLQCA